MECRVDVFVALCCFYKHEAQAVGGKLLEIDIAVMLRNVDAHNRIFVSVDNHSRTVAQQIEDGTAYRHKTHHATHRNPAYEPVHLLLLASFSVSVSFSTFFCHDAKLQKMV